MGVPFPLSQRFCEMMCALHLLSKADAILSQIYLFGNGSFRKIHIRLYQMFAP